MHHLGMVLFVAGSVVVAGALGYGFRGAIHRELTISAEEAEAWAKHIESGVEARIRAVAAEIRARLSKL